MKNYSNFCCDYINEIYRNYDLYDFKYSLKKSDLCAVLAEYISIFTTKFVIDSPRQVFISSELQAKINSSNDLNDLINYMINKIQLGENINGHLTRQIFMPEVTDKLFSDWGIKHIHLNKNEANTNEEMRYNREGPLLFAIFERDICYLIDSKKHDDEHVFSLMEYLKIVVHNWPGLLLSERTDVSCDHPIRTDEEVEIFRKNNVNAICYEIDGKLYFKNTLNGLTAAGTDILSQRLAMKMVRDLKSIDDEYESIEFKFLCNNFGTLKCKKGDYVLGLLFPPASKDLT